MFEHADYQSLAVRSVACAIALCGVSRAELVAPNLISDTIVDPHGLTGAVGAPYGRAFNGEAFQFDGITSFAGYQYAAYWAQDVPANTPDPFHVGVARRKLPGGAWQVLDLHDSVMHNALNKKMQPWDVHNTVSLGICPADGTIHLSYDHHNNTLRYRATAPGAALTPDKTAWSKALFAAETPKLTAAAPVTAVCYPAFTATPEGDLLLTFRRGQSGDGAWWIFKYSGKTHTWDAGHQYDDGRGATYDAIKPSPAQRCAYPNGWTFGPDGKLHITYVYRENFGKGMGGNGSNHDIHYAWSPDQGRSWKNDAGQTVSDIDGRNGLLPKQFSLASPGMTVVPLTQYDCLMNEQAQAVDSAGRLHVVAWHRDPTKTQPPARTWEPLESSYFHYWRAGPGDWRKAILPGPVGGRPRIVFDANDDLYAIYTTPSNPKTEGIYFDAGQLVIARATAAAKWSDWTIVATRPGPYLGEPMIDVPRVKRDGVLSIFTQDTPTADGQATPLRVIDYRIR